MAIGSISSAGAGAQSTQKLDAIKALRDEINKTTKASNGRDKKEEEKAISATAAAAGFGAGALQQVGNPANPANAAKKEQGGEGPNGLGGTTKAAQVRSTDQILRANTARGATENSFRVQQQKADQAANEIVQQKNLAEQKESARLENDREYRQQVNNQQQRAANDGIKLLRERRAEEAQVTKAQSVEVQKVEQVDPRIKAAQVQADQVQKNQETSQNFRLKQIADSLYKQAAKSADLALKEAVKGPSEVEKARSQGERKEATAAAGVGQNISVKA